MAAVWNSRFLGLGVYYTLRGWIKAGKNDLRVVHSDPVEVTRAIATLSDAELARLAARADKAQHDFAAGALSKEALLIVAIAVIVVVIIVAVKI